MAVAIKQWNGCSSARPKPQFIKHWNPRNNWIWSNLPWLFQAHLRAICTEHYTPHWRHFTGKSAAKSTAAVAYTARDGCYDHDLPGTHIFEYAYIYWKIMIMMYSSMGLFIYALFWFYVSKERYICFIIMNYLICLPGTHTFLYHIYIYICIVWSWFIDPWEYLSMLFGLLCIYRFYHHDLHDLPGMHICIHV